MINDPIQCLYPPVPPPEARLELVWDGSPVNFTDTVSYVCTVQYSTEQYSTLYR